jgi:signal transduction histidine kinase
VTEPPRPRSALATAAQILVRDGVTASGLVERFAELGATVDLDTADALLDELADLGLVRVARGNGSDRVLVLTSLGQRTDDADAADATTTDLLRDLERMRTDLLSTIAHELRTPLTAVRTSVGLLRDPDTHPTADQRDALLATIERNADRMQRLVDDSLDLTRFRAGNVHVHLQLRRFDAVELARSVIAARTAVGAGERLRLKAPTTPAPVFGDRRRLDQALDNLVSNALKYSPASEPVTVAVEAADEEVRWTVTDLGVGIPDEDRARLFERFFVGRSDRSAARDGVGLGLPIVLAVAQAHDGRVDVDSEPGRGSRFTIVVPAAGPKEGAEP